MKTLRILFIIILLPLSNSIFAQTRVSSSLEENKNFDNSAFIGIGFGFDYGGLGAKFEYLPIKYIGLNAGIGYNFYSAGWNVGGSFKILPQKVFCPYITALYGYNAVFKGTDSYTKQYESVSYGITIGLGFDYKVGKNNKISFALFIPFRSQEFQDKYNAAKNDPFVEISGELPPIGLSFGYNFGI